MTKKDFAPILDAVLKTTVKSSTLINGFKACGLFPWNPDEIDYKKCLGKNYCSTINETTTTINIANNIKNLNLKEFSDIIGIETLEKFNNIENIVETENQSEEFFILYRIYEQLKGNQQNSEVDLELEKEKSNADQSNSAIVTTSSSEVELEKEILGIPINRPDTLIKNNKNHIILKKLEISPIESCLIWPVTPERKGTRITERVPYVITSDNWKNLYENKEKNKRSIEEEKEMRKKTREENKILKETKPKKTNKRNIVKNLFSDLSRNYKPETVTSQTINLETLQFHIILL